MVESAKLSALVVARNEAAHLGACLETLRFADEIVVLLDRSTDRSVDIARGAGARLVEGAWDLEGPRRNAGYAACAGPWILEVDADERVTPELAAEIHAVLAKPGTDHFLVPIANHIGDRLVRYGWGAYNGVNATTRLFRKGAKRVLGGRVHPKVEFHGRRGILENPMLHFVDRDLSDLFARLNRYTDLAALDAHDAGRKPNVAQAFRRFWSRGWKSYVARRGYREGAYGMALALFSALYPLLIEL
ncbi:MAG: glycosyltransferase family 2 protein, partial [Stellaceae bacterium]